MMRPNPRKSLVITLASWSLVAGSTAQAAATPPDPVNPLVAVSLFGTPDTRGAVCGADCTAMAAAVAQYSDDSAADDDRQFWILAGVIAAQLLAFFLLEDVVLGDNDDDDDEEPISPA